MRQSTRPRAFTIASTALKSPPPWSQCPCESTAASLAEVDAKDGRVPAERGAFGPGVEEDGVSLVTDVRPDEQRQAVMRATDRGAGQLGETSRLTEPRPFGDDVFRWRCRRGRGHRADRPRGGRRRWRSSPRFYVRGLDCGSGGRDLGVQPTAL